MMSEKAKYFVCLAGDLGFLFELKRKNPDFASPGCLLKRLTIQLHATPESVLARLEDFKQVNWATGMKCIEQGLVAAFVQGLIAFGTCAAEIERLTVPVIRMVHFYMIENKDNRISPVGRPDAAFAGAAKICHDFGIGHSLARGKRRRVQGTPRKS